MLSKIRSEIDREPLGGGGANVGRCNNIERGGRSNNNSYDIDPEFFEWRFPVGSMRLRLADRNRRALTTPTSHILESYRYVDSFRNVDSNSDVNLEFAHTRGIGSCSFTQQGARFFFSGLFSKANAPNAGDGSMLTERTNNDTVHCSGNRLRDMESVGLVRHGQTGFPTRQPPQDEEMNSDQYANIRQTFGMEVSSTSFRPLTTKQS